MNNAELWLKCFYRKRDGIYSELFRHSSRKQRIIKYWLVSLAGVQRDQSFLFNLLLLCSGIGWDCVYYVFIYLFICFYSFPPHLQPQDLSISARRSCSSVLRIAPSFLDKTHSFITDRTNFWVTSLREDSPLISYDAEPWRPFLPALTLDLSTSAASRASVIMKAVDLSSKKT